MASVLLIFQFILTLLITIAVMLQKSSSMGLGAYSGSNESMFGAKGPANFLTKATFVLCFLFIVNTIALGYAYSESKKSSIVEVINKTGTVPAVPTIPSLPTIPAANNNSK
jgi:preprotein translocase subunit SecG